MIRFCWIQIIMLLGEHRPDQTDHRIAVGHPHEYSARRPISRFSRSVGLLDQTLVHTAFGAVVNASSSSSASSR